MTGRERERVTGRERERARESATTYTTEAHRNREQPHNTQIHAGTQAYTKTTRVRTKDTSEEGL